ncbi:Rha family transcriptional regulator [Escherichia coli]|nr:Rha family transcriptional regulator [Escherichia coli]ELF0823089.1 Rha family transcriptional regulator [Escherichia coli]
MEGGVASTLYAGSLKHSGSFTCVMVIRMSASAHYGCFVVILLSAKRHQHIDSAIPGRYTVQAPYKAGAGGRSPELSTAIYDAPASFLSSALTHARIMVGWAGEPKGSPVSVDAGTANPVQSATSEFRSSGGGSFPQSTEAAIMATIPTLTQPEIAIVDGQAVTSSLAVANFFSKRHDDVLKKIRTLECSASFTARNFSVSDYTDCTGRKLPCYQITRDGFAFLAMGFTGKRAARFKEAYINAFNQMERCLSGVGAADMPSVAQNARGVYLHLREIHQIWTSQLYPMLKAVESPLAGKLYDRVGDAVFGAALVDSRLNGSDKEAHP